MPEIPSPATVGPAVLTDPGYRVPAPDDPDAPAGLAWLRAAVPRFRDGDAHRGPRAQVDTVIAGLAVPDLPGAPPTLALLRALDLPAHLAADVAQVAAAYHPHLPVTPDADAAADRLVAACGGRTARAAAVACVLVQAHAATEALADRYRTGSDEPPVPVTRRVAPDGSTVLVDLTHAPFGDGPHACPGRELGVRLARARLAAAGTDAP